jgi:hypothetical protein
MVDPFFISVAQICRLFRRTWRTDVVITVKCENYSKPLQGQPTDCNFGSICKRKNKDGCFLQQEKVNVLRCKY